MSIYTITFKRESYIGAGSVPDPIHVDADMIDVSHPQFVKFGQLTGVKDSRGQLTVKTVRIVASNSIADIKMRNAWRIESLMDDTVFEKPLKPKRTVLGKKKSK